MHAKRPANERGQADHGWLQSRFSFSFAEYIDRDHVEFGPLRVINEDWIQPAKGFGTHGHRDMEIITYVLEGALEHKDSLGNGSVIRAGDVQRMSAGTGVMHSEFNPSGDQVAHLLQIWVKPDVHAVAPSYEEKRVVAAEKRGRLTLIAAPFGAGGAVSIHQDARVYAGLFDGVEQASLALAVNRQAYVHLATGELTVNGERLSAGDALKIRAEPAVVLTAAQNAEVLVFDLPII